MVAKEYPEFSTSFQQPIDCYKKMKVKGFQKLHT